METGESDEVPEVSPQEEVGAWGPLPLGDISHAARTEPTERIANSHGNSSATEPGGNDASSSVSTCTSGSYSSRSGSSRTGLSRATDCSSEIVSMGMATIESDTSLALAGTNESFLSQMHSTQRSSDSISMPSTLPPELNSHQRLRNSAQATNGNSTSSEGTSSAWNTSSTTTTTTTTTTIGTTTLSFPTVTVSSRHVSTRLPQSEEDVNGDDASSAGYATSVVSIPSQVLPPPTVLENAVSGLTSTMPMIEPSQQDHHHDADYPAPTELVARTTTSSSLTTLSTTMANHAFQFEQNRSLLGMGAAAPSGEGSSGSSSSAVTILQSLPVLNDTLTAAAVQAEEESKLKATADDGENRREATLKDLEHSVVAKGGVAFLPPERRQQQDHNSHLFRTQQQLRLEGKGVKRGAGAEDLRRVPRGNDALPVVQEEQPPLDEFDDALNQLPSQGDSSNHNAAQWRATFVQPGAYHQAPGQVAIRRASSAAESLQGTIDRSTSTATMAASLRPQSSNATGTSAVSTMGMTLVTALDGSGVARVERPRMVPGTSSGFPSQSDQDQGESTFPGTLDENMSSSASIMSTPSFGAPAMSISTSASCSSVANPSHTQSSTLENATNASSWVSPSIVPQTDSLDDRLVHAHPVQPLDDSVIGMADPVDASGRSRRHQHGREEAGLQRAKLPFRRRPLLLMIILCVALFLGGIIAVGVAFAIGQNSSSTAYQNGASSSSSGQSNTFIPTTQRGILIQQLLEEYGVREDIGDSQDFEFREPVSSSASPTTSLGSQGMVYGSPYSKALEWLVDHDPMSLNHTSSNVLQRFILAFFYFHTSQKGPWATCNPAQAEESEFCSYRYVKPFDEEYYESPWHIRWLSDVHECEWAGVYCESLQVDELSLNGFNLSGTFPKNTVSKLKDLKILALRDNSFSGSLPNDMWALTKLRVLRLNRNYFTGGVPFSWAILTSLLSLDVSHNSLTGTLPVFESFPLTNVEYFWANNNYFSGQIPSVVSAFTNLKQLYLNGNDFVGNLPDIGNLTLLEYFDVSSNRITGKLPTEVGRLSRLRDFVVSSTYLEGTLPEELYELSELQDLIASRCNLTGTLSTQIGQLTGLQTLMLDGNSFYGVLPTELGQLESVIHVQLHDNFFVGQVPDSICRLKGPNTLTEFIADCTPTGTGGEAKVACKDDCCSSCCDPETQICTPN